MENKHFNFDGWDSEFIALVYEGCEEWMREWASMYGSALYAKVQMLQAAAFKAHNEATK